MSYNSNMSSFFSFTRQSIQSFARKKVCKWHITETLFLIVWSCGWGAQTNNECRSVAALKYFLFKFKINIQAEFWKWAQISTDLPNAWKMRLKNSHINPGLALRCGHPEDSCRFLRLSISCVLWYQSDEKCFWETDPA